MSAHTHSTERIVKSDYGEIPLPNEDVCSFIFRKWQHWLQLDAVECVTTSQKMTFGYLLESSLRFGSELTRIVPQSSRDMQAPPIVTVFTPNLIEFAPIANGTLAAGWTLNTMKPDYTLEEAVGILGHVKPKVVVIHPSLEEIVDRAIERLQLPMEVFSFGVCKGPKLNILRVLNDETHPKIEIAKVDPSTPAIILFSGATTGKAKGIVLSHSAVTNNLVCMSDPRLFAYGQKNDPRMTVIALTPLYHSYGLQVMLLHNLYLGSKLLVCKEYNSKNYGKIVQEHKVQFLHLVPTILNDIIKSGNVTREQLRSVKGVIIAAAPVSPAAANAFRDMTSKDIIFQEGFGMTEFLGSHLTPKDSIRIGFCGKLLPNYEAKVIDINTGEPLGPNQAGEMLLRGPSRMSYYLDNPKLTAETIDEDGWLHTGDMVTYTEDGYFNVVDRLKDMMKVNGKHISPADIEDTLLKHEAVAEVGVVGVPDVTVGQRPRAYVVKRGAVTEKDLIEHVEKNLPLEKRLTGGVRFIEKIPKSPAGKTLRKELRDRAETDP